MLFGRPDKHIVCRSNGAAQESIKTQLVSSSLVSSDASLLKMESADVDTFVMTSDVRKVERSTLLEYFITRCVIMYSVQLMFDLSPRSADVAFLTIYNQSNYL